MTRTDKELARLSLKFEAEELARRARRLGFVISIEQQPLQPLAMGNHKDVVTALEARVMERRAR